jgi:hypothetical protein
MSQGLSEDTRKAQVPTTASTGTQATGRLPSGCVCFNQTKSVFLFCFFFKSSKWKLYYKLKRLDLSLWVLFLILTNQLPLDTSPPYTSPFLCFWALSLICRHWNEQGWDSSVLGPCFLLFTLPGFSLGDGIYSMALISLLWKLLTLPFSPDLSPELQAPNTSGLSG